MFSTFWAILNIKHFDGEKLLIPAVTPNTDLAILPLLGTILCNSFMVCGYLPVHIAFPVIAAILCGPDTAISDTIYCESLIDYISTYDSSLLREAVQEKTFTSSMAAITLSILSHLGCTDIPTPSNVKNLLISAAQHQFKIKPLRTLYAMHSGASCLYRYQAF